MWQNVKRPPPESPVGEGVPRESGGERDSFLRRSAEARDGMTERDTTARLVGGGVAAFAVASATGAASGGPDQRDRKSSGESGYASVSEPTANSNSTNPSRHIIPPGVLVRMYDEDGHSEDDHEPQANSPLLPPRTLDPDGLGAFGLQRPSAAHKPSNTSLHSERSVTPGNEPEGATVHTARRVRLEDMQRAQPRALSSIEDNSSPEAGPSAWTRVVGLAGLSKRLSWLNRSPSPPLSSRPRTPRSPTRPTSFAGRGLADRDLENGRGLLRAEMGYRLGEASRPISTVSSGNKSGG